MQILEQVIFNSSMLNYKTWPKRVTLSKKTLAYLSVVSKATCLPWWIVVDVLDFDDALGVSVLRQC